MIIIIIIINADEWVFDIDIWFLLEKLGIIRRIIEILQ